MKKNSFRLILVLMVLLNLVIGCGQRENFTSEYVEEASSTTEGTGTTQKKFEISLTFTNAN